MASQLREQATVYLSTAMAKFAEVGSIAGLQVRCSPTSGEKLPFIQTEEAALRLDEAYRDMPDMLRLPSGDEITDLSRPCFPPSLLPLAATRKTSVYPFLDHQPQDMNHRGVEAPRTTLGIKVGCPT